MKNIFIALSLISVLTTTAIAQKQGKVKGKEESSKEEEEEEYEEEELDFENGKGMFVPKELKNIDCKLNIAPLEKDVDLNGNTPDYFFKPIPKTGPNDKRDDISLILGGGNYVMNMKTGKLDRIPGPYDGVPTSDGEFIVSPAKGGHITFYDRTGIDKATADDYVYDDASSGQETLNGVYHSLGVLDQKNRPDGSKTVTYRAITDTITTSGDQEKMNTLEFKEYTFEISADGKKKLVGTNGAPQLLCTNYPYHMLKTPILSKDGKMVSVYNAETGTSVIYDIEKDASGKSVCKTKKDLGFAASKMEFSPDGKRVVFAMNSLGTTPSKVDWYATPDAATHNMNVYTYDFNSDNLNKISSQPNGNAYYPSFSNDGEDVVWMSQELGDKSRKYSVKRMALKDSPSMKFVDFGGMRSCKLTDDSVVSMLAIGKLWEDVCSDLQSNMNVSSLATLPLSLSKESCSKLVGKYWKENKAKMIISSADPSGAGASKSLKLKMDAGTNPTAQPLSVSDQKYYSEKILALKEEDLLKTCEGLKGVDAPKKAKTIKANMGEDKVVKANPVQSCTQCHSSGENYIPFDKPDQLGPWKKKMLLHVMTGNMPKSMNLEPEQRAELIEYLEAIDDSGVEKK